MSRYKIIDQYGLNFLTLTVVDWVDVFIRKSYKDILIDSLRFCQKQKGLVIYAYVIMSNHMHLVAAAEGDIPMSDILRDFKKFTARNILHDIEHGHKESRRYWMLHRFAYRGKMAPGDRNYQFWETDNHPKTLYSLPVIMQKINYIHMNPIKQGWVEQTEHYVYSSASNYVTGSGVLDVTVLDLPMSMIGYVPGS